MEIINYLANILSISIDISPAGARGLIKLSIKDQMGVFFPLNQLNYTNLKLIIQNSLKKRMIDLKIKEVETIIELLLSELSKNQSLITVERI